MDDVIIVGASLAGLLTGAILIQRGYRVHLLEQSSSIGGRVRSSLYQGFTVDDGLYLFRPGSSGGLATAVRAAGIPWDYRYTAPPQVYQDFNFFPFPCNTMDALRTELLPWPDRIKLASLLLRLRLLQPSNYLDISLADWLKPYNVSLTLQQFLEMLAAFGLVCPESRRVSAGEFFYYLQSWWGSHGHFIYPGGGIPALNGTLAARIQQNGQMRLNAAVERLLLSSGLVTGLQTRESERYYARAYVLALPGPSLLALMDPLALTDAERETIRQLEPTAGIFWQIGTRSMVCKERCPILTAVPPSIGLFLSNLEPALAPEGKQLATWFYPIPAERLSDSTYIDQETRWLKATVYEMFPRLKSSRQWERVLVQTRVDGALLRIGQARNRRLVQQLSRLANLFLVGDHVQAGGVGQEIACQSALIGAELVDRYLRQGSLRSVAPIS